jgi:hypothetical protein
MKKVVNALLLVFITQLSLAQYIPQEINYQAVARDASGNARGNESFNASVTIFSGPTAGTVAYTEDHNGFTNEFGLFYFKIGLGANPSTAFSNVNWGIGEHWIQVTFNGDNLGTHKLVSVPYAMISASTNGLIGAPIDLTNAPVNGDVLVFNAGQWQVQSGLSGNNSIIQNGGASVTCANGGTVLEFGTDSNGDLTLTGPEITGAIDVCDGANGVNGTNGNDILVVDTPEPPGANCVDGGTRIDYGIDSDSSGTLTAGEIQGTYYVCNGTAGINGVDGNVWTTGSGAPTGVANTGDLYLNTTNNDVYSFDGTSWGLDANLSAAETTSTLVNNGDGTFTYTDELGSAISFDTTSTETTTTLINNGDGTFTFTNELGTMVSFDTTSSAYTLSIIADADGDTEINIEASPDQDIIHFNLGDNAGYPTAEYFRMVGPRLEVLNSGRSVFIGEGAGANDDLTMKNNIFIGTDAGNTNTNGFINVGVGQGALQFNSTGYGNVAVGNFALQLSTTSSENTAVGQIALGGNTIGTANTAIGSAALNTNTIGNYNTSLGMNSMYSSLNGSGNSAVGVGSLSSNVSGNDNTAVGSNSLVSSLSDNNTAIGNNAGQTITTGNNNTFLGYNADASINSLTNATAVGTNTIVGASNSVILGNNANVGIGTSTPSNKLEVVGDAAKFDSVIIVNGAIAGYVLTSDAAGSASWQPAGGTTSLIQDADGDTEINLEASPDQDVIHFSLGDNAGYPGAEYFTMIGPRLEVINSGGSVMLGAGAGANDDLTNNRNVLLGFESGVANTVGFNNVASGYRSLYSNTSGDRNVGIGYESLYNSTSSDANVGIGAGALYSNVAGSRATAVGTGAMYYVDNATGPANIYNVAFGYEALRGTTTAASNTGTQNSAIGYQSLFINSTGSRNTALGHSVLFNNSIGNDNIGIGYITMFDNLSGNENIALGSNTLRFNQSGDANIGIGVDALRTNISGDNNVAVGDNALRVNTSSENTALGRDAGLLNTTGSNNTFIGSRSNASASNLINASAIGYNTTVQASNTVQLGNGADVDFDGALMPNSLAGNLGEVLTSQGPGVSPIWQPASGGSGWDLLGNTGTSSATDFIGTTDGQALRFKTNNVQAIYIGQTNQNVGIGTENPLGRFHTAAEAGMNINVFEAASSGGVDEAATLSLVRARGSLGSKQAVNANDRLGDISFNGFNDGTSAYEEGARIAVNAIEPFNSTGAGSEMKFSTTPLGLGSPEEAMIIKENGFVGIGTDAPLVNLMISGDNKTIVGVATYESGTDHSSVAVLRSRGNELSPLNVQNGDVLGLFEFLGYNSADMWIRAGAIRMDATESYSSTGLRGGKMIFEVEQNANAGVIEAMVIDQTGNVGIGTLNPTTSFHLNGGHTRHEGAQPAGATAGSTDVKGAVNVNFATSGSIIVTFTTVFTTVPTVIITPVCNADPSVNARYWLSNITSTGFTVNWSGSNSTPAINYMVIE